MVKLLKRLDYRFKQPDVLPSKADPEKQAAWVVPRRRPEGLEQPPGLSR
ncbi:MAG: winged helix-turn-helix domain-containing protein [Herpetosiphonaceae bacterium]|nr:winged helix-turn-helix domain-containing protein [Herpetosiphonaceae bacterium]